MRVNANVSAQKVRPANTNKIRFDLLLCVYVRVCAGFGPLTLLRFRFCLPLSLSLFSLNLSRSLSLSVSLADRRRSRFACMQVKRNWRTPLSLFLSVLIRPLAAPLLVAGFDSALLPLCLCLCFVFSVQKSERASNSARACLLAQAH